jgi:hypothetical protein
MSQTPTPLPMLAKTAEPFTSRILPRDPSPKEAILPPEADPEAAFELLRRLIEDGQIATARRLTVEAARRFPDHDRIRLARHILNDAKATPDPYVQPTAGAEIEWLKEPPEEARGKWVALIGSEVVSMADSADELMTTLRSKNLEHLPVVQYVAP